MIVLLYDTETSGMPDWGVPSDADEQPHICQYSAVLFDDRTGDETSYWNHIVVQEWPVHPKAFAVHRITPERSHEEGIPERIVVGDFLNAVEAAQRVAAFNNTFDERIMRIAMLRAGISRPTVEQFWTAIKPRTWDVMRAATPHAKVPPTGKMMARGRYTFKNPSVAEAYQALIGQPMQDAHDARGDLLATKEIYMWLKERGHA